MDKSEKCSNSRIFGRVSEGIFVCHNLQESESFESKIVIRQELTSRARSD